VLKAEGCKTNRRKTNGHKTRPVCQSFLFTNWCTSESP